MERDTCEFNGMRAHGAHRKLKREGETWGGNEKFIWFCRFAMAPPPSSSSRPRPALCTLLFMKLCNWTNDRYSHIIYSPSAIQTYAIVGRHLTIEERSNCLDMLSCRSEIVSEFQMVCVFRARKNGKIIIFARKGLSSSPLRRQINQFHSIGSSAIAASNMKLAYGADSWMNKPRVGCLERKHFTIHLSCHFLFDLQLWHAVVECWMKFTCWMPRGKYSGLFAFGGRVLVLYTSRDREQHSILICQSYTLNRYDLQMLEFVYGLCK